MKFHFYGQKGFVNLPRHTTIEDLRALAHFNKVIKNYLKMERLKEEEK